MKTNNEIAGAALAARDRHEKEMKKRLKSALALAAALALTVGGAAAVKGIVNRQPARPGTDASAPRPGETAENTAPRQDTAAPSALTEERGFAALTGAEGFTVKTGPGMACMASFSEARFLGGAEILAEVTVTDVYVKQYFFKTEYEGKFENAGQKMTITYEPQSFVTEARVEKIWRGPADLHPGDTVTFEDEILYTEGVFGCEKGKTYVVALMRGAADVEDSVLQKEPLIEGDTARVTLWRQIYPYIPPIEKTLTGDYIAHSAWESLTGGAETVEISVAADAPFCERDCAGRLRLVPAAVFGERMRALADAKG